MIKLILGGIGSGKSLSLAKFIINKKEQTFGNFDVKTDKTKYHRLKISDVINIDEKTGKPKSINWEFWEEARKEHGGFHICLDEVHNLMHSRRSMSNRNVLLSKWVAQMRKVTGANEHFDFIAVSQVLERIDGSIRDLANEIMFCTKLTTDAPCWTEVYDEKTGQLVKRKLKRTYIVMTYFLGENCVLNYRRWRILKVKSYNFRTSFIANYFYKYFNSYEFVKFGDEGYL